MLTVEGKSFNMAAAAILSATSGAESARRWYTDHPDIELLVQAETSTQGLPRPSDSTARAIYGLRL